MNFNTVSLSVGEAPVGPVGLQIGDEFPVGNRFSIPRVAIRFETKDRVTGDPRPGNGITLNAMVVSNAAPHYELALKRGNSFVGDCVAFSKEDVQCCLHGLSFASRVCDADGPQCGWHLLCVAIGWCAGHKSGQPFVAREQCATARHCSCP